MDEMGQEDLKGELTHPEELSGSQNFRTHSGNGFKFARQGTFNSVYLDKEGLKDEVQQFTWPLHFIDFETTAPAIPFYKGYAPYQG